MDKAKHNPQNAWSFRRFGRKVLKTLSVLIVLISFVGPYTYIAAQPASAANQIPKLLNYQARITNSSGVPVSDGNLNIWISVYDASSGGSCLYAMRGSCGTPSYKTVTVTNGVFSTLIGDTAGGDNEIPDTLFDANTLYLGVTVASDTEMVPRKRITAAPYALNADKLDDLDVTSSGSTTPYIPSTTANGNLVITGDPQGGGVGQGSLYVNPATPSASEILFGVANNGTRRWMIDAEGDIDHLGSMLATAASSTAQFIFRGAASQSQNIFEVQTTLTNRMLAVSATATTIGSTSSTDAVVFNSRVGSNLTPTTDATFDLGDYNRRWKSLWLSGGTANIAYDTSGTSVLSVGFESSEGLRGVIKTPDNIPLQIRSGNSVTSGITVSAGGNVTIPNLTVTSCTGCSGGSTSLNQAYLASTSTNELYITPSQGALTIADTFSGTGNIFEIQNRTNAAGDYSRRFMTVSSTSTLFNGSAVAGYQVGIGTSAPGAPLHVDSAAGGQIFRLSSTSEDLYGQLAGGSGNIAWGVWNNPGSDPNYPVAMHAWLGTGTSYPLSFRTSNVSRMVIGSNGDVAIGRQSATSRLTVSASTTTPTANIFEVTNSTLGQKYLTTSGTSTFVGSTQSGYRLAVNTTGARQTLSVGDNLDLYSGSVNSPTQPSIRGTSVGNMVIQGTGSGSVYLSYDSGSGGVIFGSGALAAVGRVNSSGYATFGSASDLAGVTYALYANGAPTFFNGGGTSSPVMTITGGLDATLSASGYLVLGSVSGANIVIDDNELMARNNGAKAQLFIQNEGGDLLLHAGQAGTEFVLQDAGNVGIGNLAPANKLTVGTATSTFEVNTAGNLIKINNVAYSWPSSQGGASTVLTNNGSGSLTWTSASGLTNLNQAYLNSSSTAEISLSPSIGALTVADTFSGTGNIFEIQDRTNAAGDYSQRYLAVSSTSTNIDSGTFVVDHANNRVGIGVAVPLSRLQVSGGDIRVDVNATIFANGTGALNIGDSSDSVNVANGALYALSSTGFVGVGNAAPANKFTVGTTSTFEVDVNGNLVKVNNVAYSWPSSQGGASTVLTNNGSGSLTWTSASGLTNLNQAYLNSSSTAEISLSPSIGALTVADTFSGTGNIFEIQDRTNAAGDYSMQYLTVSATGTNIAHLNVGTGDVLDALTIKRLSSGAAATGLGAGLVFRLENSGGSDVYASRVNSVWTDSATGTEDSRMDFSVSEAGVTKKVLSLTENYAFVGAGTANRTLQGGATLNGTLGHALLSIEGFGARDATLSLESSAVAGGPSIFMETTNGTAGSKAWKLSTNATNQLSLANISESAGTNNVEAMTFDRTGNVVFQTSTAGLTSNLLEVRDRNATGYSAKYMTVSSTSTLIGFGPAAAVSGYLVGIGQGAPTAKLHVTPDANDEAVTVSGYSITGSNSNTLLSLTGTWNTSGAPIGIHLNITDTSSSGNSTLMTLQQSGVTRFNLNKSGATAITLNNSFAITGTSALALNNTDASANNFSSIYFGDGAGVGSIISNQFLNHGASNVSNVIFQTRDNAGTLATRLTIGATSTAIVGDLTVTGAISGTISTSLNQAYLNSTSTNELSLTPSLGALTISDAIGGTGNIFEIQDRNAADAYTKRFLGVSATGTRLYANAQSNVPTLLVENAGTAYLEVKSTGSNPTSLYLTRAASGNTWKLVDDTVTSEALDFTFNSTNRLRLTTTGLLTQTVGTTGTVYDVDLSSSWTTGTVFNTDFSASLIQSGAITGTSHNFNTNLTAVAGNNITGYDVQLPILTNGSVNSSTYTGYNISSAGALTNSGTGTFINWRGLNVTMPVTQTVGNSFVSATGVNITGTASNSGSRTGLGIEMGQSTGGSETGIWLLNPSSGGGSEVGVRFGPNWDAEMRFDDASPLFQFADGSTTTLADTNANTLMTLVDAGSTGNLTVTGNLAIGSASGTNTVDFTNARIASNLTPTTDATFDLGDYNRRWRDLWLSGGSLNVAYDTSASTTFRTSWNDARGRRVLMDSANQPIQITPGGGATGIYMDKFGRVALGKDSVVAPGSAIGSAFLQIDSASGTQRSLSISIPSSAVVNTFEVIDAGTVDVAVDRFGALYANNTALFKVLPGDTNTVYQIASGNTTNQFKPRNANATAVSISPTSGMAADLNLLQFYDDSANNAWTRFDRGGRLIFGATTTNETALITMATSTAATMILDIRDLNPGTSDYTQHYFTVSTTSTHAYGRLTVGEGTSGSDQIELYDSSNNNYFRLTPTAQNEFQMDLEGAATTGRLSVNQFLFGIGNTAPSSALTVGSSTSTFEVDFAGNLVKIRNVAYSWPASQGGASTVLTNDGSGNLSWASAGGSTSLNSAYLNSTSTNELYITPSQGALTIADTFSGTGNIFEIQNRTNDTGDYSTRYLTVSATSTNISTGTETYALNLGTGAGAKTIVMGSTTGASAVTVTGGTGLMSFGAQAVAHTTTIGSTTGASVLNLQNGTGLTTISSLATTGNAFNMTANSVTSGTALNLSATALTTGSSLAITTAGSTAAAINVSMTSTNCSTCSLMRLAKTAATGSTSQTGNLASIAYTQTFNGGNTVNTGNVFSVYRSTNLNASGSVVVGGSVAEFSDAFSMTAGWVNHGGNVVQVAQNFVGATNTALLVTSSATGGGAAYISGEFTPLTVASRNASPSYNLFEIQNGTVVNSGTSIAPYTQRYFTVSSTSTAVGTSNPLVRFQVANGTSGISYTPNVRTAAIIEGNNSNGTTLSITGPATGNANGIFLGSPTNESAGQITYDNTNGSLSLSTGGGAVASTLYFSPSAQFGIGNVTPSAKLTLSDASDAPTSNIFEIQNTSGGGGYTSRYLSVSATNTTFNHASLSSQTAVQIEAPNLASGFGLVVNAATSTFTSNGAALAVIGPSSGTITTSSGRGLVADFRSSATIQGTNGAAIKEIFSGITTGAAHNIQLGDTFSTGRGLEIEARSANFSSGRLLSVQKTTITSGSTAFSGDVANFGYLHTQTSGTLNNTGTVVNASRTLTVNGASALQTGPVAKFADDLVLSSGWIRHGANVVSISQSFAGATNTALGIVSSATGGGGAYVAGKYEPLVVAGYMPSPTSALFAVQNTSQADGVSYTSRYLTVSSTGTTVTNLTVTGSCTGCGGGSTLNSAYVASTSTNEIYITPSLGGFTIADAGTYDSNTGENSGLGGTNYANLFEIQDRTNAAGDYTNRYFWASATGVGVTGGIMMYQGGPGSNTISAQADFVLAPGGGGTVQDTGSFQVDGNTTLGNASGDTLTTSFGTWNVNNQITTNFGTNKWIINSSQSVSNAIEIVANSLSTGNRALAVYSSAAFSTSEIVSIGAQGASSGNLLGFTSTNASATSKAINIDLDNGNNNNVVFDLTTDETSVSGTSADTQKFTIYASGSVISDGNLSFGSASGTNTINFSGARIASNLTPTADNTYSLGDYNRRWKDLWLSGGTAHVAYDTSGTTSLDIGWKDTDGMRARIYSAGQPLQITSQNTVNSGLYITADGNIGVGTSTPSAAFEVRGKVPTAAAGSVQISTTESGTRDIMIQGDYAYILQCSGTTSCSIYVVDITNPKSPALVAVNPVDKASESLGVHGDYAYIQRDPGTARTLGVYDISDPSSIVEIGSAASTGSNFSASDLAVSGRYVYTAGTSLNVYDVGNPVAPTRVGSATIGAGSSGSDVKIRGDWVYAVADGGSQVSVYRVSSPTSPVQVSTISTSSTPMSIDFKGNYAYITNFSNNNINIYDVSDPSAPVNRAVFNVAGTGPGEIFIQGDRAYVVIGSSQLIQILDISNPVAPVSLGTISIASVGRVAVQGRYLYTVKNTVSNYTFEAYDIGGAYIQSLDAGSLKATDIQAAKNLYAEDGWFRSGLHVSGSTLVDGYLSVQAATSTSVAANLLELGAQQVTGGTFTGKLAYLNLGTSTTGQAIAINSTGAYTSTSGIIGITASGMTSGYALNIDANAVSGGNIVNIRSTSNDWSTTNGLRVSLSNTAETQTLVGGAIGSFSGNVVYNTAVTTPSILMNTLSVTRAITTQGAFASTATVSGAVMAISDSGTQTTGTLTHTGNVLSLAQSYSASTGPVLKVSHANLTSGNAIAFAVDDGTRRFDVSSTGTTRVNLPLSTGNWGVCHRESNGASTLQTLVDCAATPAADYMEMYPAATDLEVGDIVMPGTTTVMAGGTPVPQVVKSAGAYEGAMLGVMSDPNEAGDFNSIGHNVPAEANPKPVALKGRVKVKVNMQNGAIKVGDPITSSSVPGVGMKSTKPGMIVGQALEAWNGPGQGMILVFMGNGFHSGLAIATDGVKSLFNDDFAFLPPAYATASQTAIASRELSFVGSAWDSGSSTSVIRSITMGNVVTDMSNYQMAFKNDQGQTLATLNNMGDLALAGSLSVNGGFDYAEQFPATPDLDAGDIVMVDAENVSGYGVKKSDKAYENTVIGVISTKPGFITGKKEEDTQPVALAGRVPVKVSAVNGEIKPGDPITSSSVAGVGMKATEAGRVVGIALKGWNGSGVGVITLFVNPSWWNGPTPANGAVVSGSLSITQDSLIDFKNSILSNVAAIISTNGTWSVTADGYLAAVKVDAKQVEAEAYTVRAGSDPVGRTVGVGRIAAGGEGVMVSNPAITADSLIVVTFESNPGTNWWIDEKHDGLFVLKLASPAHADQKFTYWIVGVDGALDPVPIGSGSGTPETAPTDSGTGTPGTGGGGTGSASGTNETP